MSTLSSSGRLRNILNRRLGDYQPAQVAFTGIMGDGTGTVTVPNRANYVYVRRAGRGRIEEVLNVRLTHRNGLPVVVGYAPEDPEELQILSVDTAAVSALDTFRYTAPHHDAHEFGSAVGGDDVVWVQKPQYVPLHCHPTNPTSMLVEVEDDFYPWQAGWSHFDGDTIDLTASVPPGGLWANSRFVLVSIDGATNALQLTDGAIFLTAIPPSPIWDAIPAPPAGSIPIAAVLLNGTTVTITWDEIYDVRIHNSPVGGSVLPAPHNLLNVTYHSDTVTQTVSRGSLIYGNATPLWDELTIGAAGAALFSDGADVSWTTTPVWSGLHTFNTGITFGGATGVNVVTVPDNVAQALNLVDAGGLEYLRLISTNAQPLVHWNQSAADVDFRVDAFGVVGMFVQGSDGYVGIRHTAPTYHIHLTDNVAAGRVGVGIQTNTGYPSHTLIAADDTNWKAGRFEVLRSNNYGLCTAASRIFELLGQAHDGTGYFEVGAARLEFDGGIGAGDLPTKWTWYVTPDGSTAMGAAMVIKNSGRVGIGETGAPLGMVHIDQLSATGAIPVLVLDQGDVSEEFIRYIGYAAAATLTQSLVNEADVTTATRVGWFKIYVRDDGNQITDGYYYVPFYSLV